MHITNLQDIYAIPFRGLLLVAEGLEEPLGFDKVHHGCLHGAHFLQESGICKCLKD